MQMTRRTLLTGLEPRRRAVNRPATRLRHALDDLEHALAERARRQRG